MILLIDASHARRRAASPERTSPLAHPCRSTGPLFQRVEAGDDADLRPSVRGSHRAPEVAVAEVDERVDPLLRLRPGRFAGAVGRPPHQIVERLLDDRPTFPVEQPVERTHAVEQGRQVQSPAFVVRAPPLPADHRPPVFDDAPSLGRPERPSVIDQHLLGIAELGHVGGISEDARVLHGDGSIGEGGRDHRKVVESATQTNLRARPRVVLERRRRHPRAGRGRSVQLPLPRVVERGQRGEPQRIEAPPGLVQLADPICELRPRQAREINRRLFVEHGTQVAHERGLSPESVTGGRSHTGRRCRCLDRRLERMFDDEGPRCPCQPLWGRIPA